MNNGIEVPGQQENEMSEWQPIETAPRDGTFVLLSGHDLPVWQGSWVGTSGRYAINGWTRFNSVDINWNPTHWKPLPEPPNTQLQSPPPLEFEEAVALAEERDTWFTRPHFDGIIVMLSGITGAKVKAGSRLARAFKEGTEVQIDRIFMHCSPDMVARSWWPTAADSEATDWVVGPCAKR